LRDEQWQRDFLARPITERRRIAAELRELSRTEMAAKSEEIMDVNEAAVRETMRRHGVRALLHGHTHRPAIHHFDLDGEAAVRVVLSDWYGPGGYACWTADGPALQDLRTRQP
jgi:UDP-2,3-diacylglucosamine hydrolase